MPKIADQYTYRVSWSEKDQAHIGLCSEFPSLSWLAKTPEEALSGIRKLVKGCVTDMKQNDEEIPEPFSIKSFSGKFVVRVSPETHRTLVMKAAEAGISLNRFVSSRLE